MTATRRLYPDTYTLGLMRDYAARGAAARAACASLDDGLDIRLVKTSDLVALVTYGNGDRLDPWRHQLAADRELARRRATGLYPGA